MTSFVGIDGIRGGWVAVYLNADGSQRFAYARLITELLVDPYQRAMVDMPIGLPESGYRKCDIDARKLVGSRVFLGARSGVWEFQTLGEANEHYWKAEGPGFGISMQLFCIRDKLQELNDGSSPVRLCEAHPELIFWRLAGCVLESKNTERGREQRIKILEDKGIGKIRQWLGQRYGTGIGRDDLIDACACALAARDSEETLQSGDAHNKDGTRSEIWY